MTSAKSSPFWACDQVGFPELRLVRRVSPAHAAALALGWTQRGPALRVLDAAGNAPVFVGVTDQGPALTLNAPGDSGAGASLQVDAQGASTLALTDNDGLAQAGAHPQPRRRHEHAQPQLLPMDRVRARAPVPGITTRTGHRSC